MVKCLWHLCDNPARVKFCSRRCKERFKEAKRRRERKLKIVEYLGGSCSACGYAKCVAALACHHIDPSTKEFDLGRHSAKAWPKIQAELDKCVLLCHNCHTEAHYGT